MILFDTDIEGGNGNNDMMNDFVIVPPTPDTCLMGRFDEYSYANLYDYYNPFTQNHSNSPALTQLINGASAGKTGTAMSPSSIEVSANTTAAALVSCCSSLPTSDSSSDECFRQTTDDIPLDSRTNNYEYKNVSKTKTSASVITRDPRNGAFTFQVHAEFDLLLHVKKDLFLLDNKPDGGRIRLSEHIMHSIDEYCLKKQWMYHIGSEKGTAVSRFLRSRLEIWHEENIINSHNCSGNREGDKKVRAMLHSGVTTPFTLCLMSPCSGFYFHSLTSTYNYRLTVKTPKFMCVELGTYCGYSALVIAVTIHQFLHDLQHQLPQRLSTLSLTSDDRHCEMHIADVGSPHPSPFEFHIYTTEISTKLLNVAQSFFRLAKMEDCITPILVKEEFDHSTFDNVKSTNATNMIINRRDGDGKDNFNTNGIHATHEINDHETNESSAESLSHTLKQQYGVSKIDFLLLDHAKHMYLHDLHTLERSGLVGKGSYVSADNVVFNRLDAYRDHMRQLESIGVVETRLEEMCLEYSNNLKDGIGEYIT